MLQRLRIKFSRNEAVKFISHLDLMRLWQRAFVRAGISLTYSEGFNPHPRMALAAPLAVGVTSEAELMDVVLSKQVSPHYFTAALAQQLPSGISILQVFPVASVLPSLQSQVRWAEYTVDLEAPKEKKDVESAISHLLSLPGLMWQHQRDTGPKKYDLRALIDDLWLIAWTGDRGSIGMRLRSDSSGSGRPEQVAAALGFTDPPLTMHRTRLILEGS